LDAVESSFQINRDVVSVILSEGQKQLKPGFDERRDNTCFSNITDAFGITEK
jgi:hypothetical protein